MQRSRILYTVISSSLHNPLASSSCCSISKHPAVHRSSLHNHPISHGYHSITRSRILMGLVAKPPLST
ncbi:hypothetical protein WAI453_004735 [Rhynchosporium graminicola]